MALFEKTQSTILRHLKIYPHTQFHCSCSKILPIASNLAFQSKNNLTTRWCFLRKFDSQLCAFKKYAHMQNFIILTQKFGRWHPFWRFGNKINHPTRWGYQKIMLLKNAQYHKISVWTNFQRNREMPASLASNLVFRLLNKPPHQMALSKNDAFKKCSRP